VFCWAAVALDLYLFLSSALIYRIGQYIYSKDNQKELKRINLNLLFLSIYSVVFYALLLILRKKFNKFLEMHGAYESNIVVPLV
jgi:hypothetical protein